MADTTELRARLVDGANNVMQAAAIEAFADLLAAAPRESGELIQSGYVNQVGEAPRVTWVVGFTAPQGEWVEFGTEPHSIFPTKPGGVLHWFDAITGEDVFARYVLDNSITPQPWFFPTLALGWPGYVEANLDAAGWG